MMGSSMKCLLFTLEPTLCIHQVLSELKLDDRRASPATQNGWQHLRQMQGGQTTLSWSFWLVRAFSYSCNIAISRWMVGGRMFARTENTSSILDFGIPVTFSGLSTRLVCSTWLWNKLKPILLFVSEQLYCHNQ